MFEYLREKYPTVFLISFPDGTEIPFKPLTFGEFNHYNELLETGSKNPVKLEDEIFRKCVLSEAIVRNINRQKAGTVSTTVQSIMFHSGPPTIQSFNEQLQFQRERAQTPIHAIPALICRAFPSYTPDDIEQMSYETMMLRLAQAEPILMQYGIIQQPIHIEDARAQEKPTNAPPPQELKSVWEESMNMNGKKKKPVKKGKPIDTELGKRSSPAVEKRSDIMGLMKDSLSPEAQDAHLDDDHLARKMKEDAKWIFADLIEELRKEQAKKKK